MIRSVKNLLGHLPEYDTAHLSVMDDDDSTADVADVLECHYSLAIRSPERISKQA